MLQAPKPRAAGGEGARAPKPSPPNETKKRKKKRPFFFERDACTSPGRELATQSCSPGPGAEETPHCATRRAGGAERGEREMAVETRRGNGRRAERRTLRAGGEARRNPTARRRGAVDGAGWGFPRCVATERTEERRRRVECAFAVLYGTVGVGGRQPEAREEEDQHSGRQHGGPRCGFPSLLGVAVGSSVSPIATCPLVLRHALRLSVLPGLSLYQGPTGQCVFHRRRLRPLICIRRSHSAYGYERLGDGD